MKKIRVKKIGRPEWIRYVLADQRRRYWTGSGWSKVRRKAALFAGFGDAAKAYLELESQQWNDQPMRHFSASVNVVVRGKGEFDVEALQDYLCGAVAILLDHDRRGAGPVPGTVAQVLIDWGQMTEVIQDEGGVR